MIGNDPHSRNLGRHTPGTLYPVVVPPLKSGGTTITTIIVFGVDEKAPKQ